MTPELIIDNFAGGGGASTGIEIAIGRSVDVAINHDPDAIAMHEANHPETRHYCESVWEVDPREAAGGQPVGLVWLSPDCKHFSKAKGGKPVQKNVRGLAWVAVRWAATVKPRVIMLENVEEFKTWGPLLKDGYPDPKQKGRTFNCFVNALRRLGYKVDWRELRACDYGAPTIRKRLFLVARCDGRPIEWPEPTHGDPASEAVKSGRLKPWRTAAEIIDWSIPCKSIFGRTKPLAENTERRIARGIQRFVLDAERPFVAPFIARIGQTGFGKDRLQYELADPLTTITTKAEHLLVAPVMAVNTSGHPGSALEEPLRTITTGGHHMLVSPALIQMGYGERPGQEPRVLDLDKPVGTVTAGGNKFALAAAHITKFRGGATGHAADEPLHTVTSGAGAARPAGAAHALGLVTAFIAKHYGGNYSGAGVELAEPLPTVTTKDHNSLVTAHIARHFGQSVGSAAEEPVGTVTAGGMHVGEVRAFLKRYILSEVGHECNKRYQAADIQESIGNTSERRNLENSNREKQRRCHDDGAETSGMQIEERIPGNQDLCKQQAVSCVGASSSVDVVGRENTGRNGLEPQGRKETKQQSREFGSGDPEREFEACSENGIEGLRQHRVPSIERGNGTSEGRDELRSDCKANGNLSDNSISSDQKDVADNGQQLTDPLHTVTTKDRFGLVTIEGVDYQIVDIGMRMLEPHELFAAQGFPASYIIDKYANGKAVPKSAQVARCGNSVCPPLATALVRANLPELCVGSGKVLAFERYATADEGQLQLSI